MATMFEALFKGVGVPIDLMLWSFVMAPGTGYLDRCYFIELGSM